MNKTLGLNENEALKNTLKLEAIISPDVLKKLKSFIKYSNNKLVNDKNYKIEFDKFYSKELKNEKTE